MVGVNWKHSGKTRIYHHPIYDHLTKQEMKEKNVAIWFMEPCAPYASNCLIRSCYNKAPLRNDLQKQSYRGISLINRLLRNESTSLHIKEEVA